MSKRHNNKWKKTILKRKDTNKEKFLAQLKTFPVVEVACKRAGISRATVYRWRDEDSEFAEAIETAKDAGIEYMNDLTESQLISLIREKHPTSVRFWLQRHHPRYAQKNGHVKFQRGDDSFEVEFPFEQPL